MTFWVGQKVVCIIEQHRWVVEDDDGIAPEKGRVYTVASIVDGSPIGIRLVEIINRPLIGWNEPCYWASGFRPATDISFAHEILRAASQKVDV